MRFSRLLLRAFLGRRHARVSGTVEVCGLTDAIGIRRHEHGIPVVEANSETDAWFGLGFCHGQDRSFQLEVYRRVVRGTLAEIVGPPALPIDRLSRRIGFRRAAERQLHLIDPALRPILESYAEGINAGTTLGVPRRAHEFALLRAKPAPWDAADPLGFLKLQSFVMAANWDVELARLLILTFDGPDALRSVDPVLSLHSHPSVSGHLPTVLECLNADIAALAGVIPFGGGSNNWAIGGTRTASGKPLLANDTHLAPIVPLHWYLAHLHTPDWSIAGASFVGTPTIPVGHNGHIAWGVTAGLTDNTDLFIEQLGPDGASIRQNDCFVPSQVIREVIHVKGAEPIVEKVLITPHGPIISPALEGVPIALSLRAVWLDDHPLRGWLSATHARSFEDFRRAFEQWPGLPHNIVYADVDGHIGWQLVGQAPVRKRGNGLLPMPGWDASFDWEDECVPFEAMPHAFDPPTGFVGSANNRPTAEGESPFLGLDWMEGYRIATIRSELQRSENWTPERCTELQLSVDSLPWHEMREAVLAMPGAGDPEVQRALDLLKRWDGRIAANSAAAAVYELFVSAMARKLAKAKAPKSWRWAVGQGFSAMHPDNFFCYRRIGHLSRLVRAQPEGWFAEGWPAAIRAALAESVRELTKMCGRRESDWEWGKVRPLRFKHILFGEVRGLSRVFNLGPIPWGGDDSTPNQSAVLPLNPAQAAHNVPGLRAVLDVGNWSKSQFALAGGQSGNPLSPHYEDLLKRWQQGEGVRIPWMVEEVQATTGNLLKLVPLAW